MATSKYFFEDIKEKIVKENLFSEIADEETQKFIKLYTDNRGNKKPLKGTPSSTQIRKFFNDILSMKQKIDLGKSKPEKKSIFKK